MDELGNSVIGEISEIRKKENIPFIQLNVKVSSAIKKEVKKLNSNYAQIIEIIFVCLLAHNKISYSRNSSVTEPKKYNKHGISNYRIVRAIDELVNLGLVDNYIAKQSFNNDFVKDVSHIEATELFKTKYSSLKEISKSRKTVVKDRQSVILKDANGTRIDYRDNEYTTILRKKLTYYNEFASGFLVEHKGERLNTTLDAHYKHSFNDYGRLYGADYQVMPKQDRHDIVIEKEQTMEIDYKNLHFRMLLDMFLLSHNVNINDDLYSIPLTTQQQKYPANREMIKRMFNMFINTTSKQSAMQAMQGDINSNKRDMGTFTSVKEIYKCLEDAYPFIFNNDAIMRNIYCGKPMAALLQNKESRMAVDIITTGAEVGVMICSIHDSFKVDLHNAYFLAKIMGDSYRKEMNTNNGVLVDVMVGCSKWQQIV